MQLLSDTHFAVLSDQQRPVVIFNLTENWLVKLVKFGLFFSLLIAGLTHPKQVLLLIVRVRVKLWQNNLTVYVS